MKRNLLVFLSVLGYLLAVFGVLALTALPIKLIFGSSDLVERRLDILLLGLMFVISVSVVNAVIARRGGAELVKAGWHGYVSSTRWFGIGVLFGLIVTAVMLGLTAALGGGTVSLDINRLPDYLSFVGPLLFCLLIAALGEEWLFRGYPLTKLSTVLGQGSANAIVSLMFMLGHWGSEGWTALVVANLFLFSMVHGAIRFTPGGIPAAWGFHFAWNSLHVLLGATLTGDNLGVPGIDFSGEGPSWLSGGEYGPEGGIATTALTIASLLLLWRYSSRHRAAEAGLRNSQAPSSSALEENGYAH